MANPLDDLPVDISPSLRAALVEHFEANGSIPPRRRWLREFGPERATPEDRNRWMLM